MFEVGIIVQREETIFVAGVFVVGSEEWFVTYVCLRCAVSSLSL